MSSGRLRDSLSLSLLSEHYLCGGGKHPMRKTLDFAQNTQKTVSLCNRLPGRFKLLDVFLEHVHSSRVLVNWQDYNRTLLETRTV